MERAEGLRAVAEVEERHTHTQFKHDSEAEDQLSPLMKLTHVAKDRNKASEALAGDDLTGMRLDAGKSLRHGTNKSSTPEIWASGKRYRDDRHRQDDGNSSRPVG